MKRKRSIGGRIQDVAIIVGIIAVLYFVFMFLDGITSNADIKIQYSIVGFIATILSVLFFLGFGELVENVFEIKQFLKANFKNDDNDKYEPPIDN